MKKIISVVLLLSVCLSSLLLFSSCGKKSDDNAVNLFSEEGLLCVGRGDKYGYIDKKGKEVIPCKYTDAEAFENGYAVVQETEDGSYYYIKPNGSRLMETPFYRAQNFDSQGRAVVKRSEKGKAELIDKSGKVYLTAKSILSSDNGLYLYKDDADLWGVANKSGKTLLTPSYDDLDFVYDLKDDGKNVTETVNKDRLIATRKLSSGSAYYLIDLDGEEYY
ncbi:MAG: WG repeat-containing protein, partial [Clostridia bacterium]|nr:WG repeat-containing protein [Clostridia bacterium]